MAVQFFLFITSIIRLWLVGLSSRGASSPGQILVPVCWLPQYKSRIQIRWWSHQCCHRGVGGQMLTPVCWLPQYKSRIQITWCSYQCCHRGVGGDRYPSTSLKYRSHGAVISVIIGGGGGTDAGSCLLVTPVQV